MITDKSGDAFSVLITVGIADASVVDHRPEELLNITATGTLSSGSGNVGHALSGRRHVLAGCSIIVLSSRHWRAAGFRMEYASGIGVEGTYSNFRVLCQNIQVDDQSPFTRYVVSSTHHQHMSYALVEKCDMLFHGPDATPGNLTVSQVPCGHRRHRGGDCDRRGGGSGDRAAACHQPVGGQPARPAAAAGLLPVHCVAPLPHPAGAGPHCNRFLQSSSDCRQAVVFSLLVSLGYDTMSWC